MSGIPLLQLRWVRVSIIAGIALASFVTALAIAYELALARVPRHRAALESLVRGQTGLDIRFNELSFRMGWYGPEAVFRRVELGEPGRSNVLLRAPQLIVAINAWQTARSGQLVAGRITLIAPDIDLERLTRSPPAAPSASRVPGTQPQATGARATQVRVLDRWKGGVIDLQGGTLRLPDPAGGANPLTLQIRRAAVRRAGNEWSGHALVFLPERLGRTARVVAQLSGDINTPSSLSGGLRFEGVRLSFASWRGALAELPRVAGSLPLAGSGDVTVDLTLEGGRVEKADGQVRAADLVVGTPTWLFPVQHSRAALSLGYVSGDWRFLRRADTSQLQVEQLVLSREQRESPLPRFTVEMSGGHVHSSLEAVPLGSIAAIAHWFVPELASTGVALDGTAEDIDVDWNAARPEGFRLAASARVDRAIATHESRRFTLKGLSARVSASEQRIGLELDSPTTRLELASDPQAPFESLALVGRASMTRFDQGWQIDVPRFTFEDAAVSGELTGTLAADVPGARPVLDLRGAVAYADVSRVQQVLVDSVPRVLGSMGTRVASGRIESAAFELKGATDSLFASAPVAASGGGVSARRAAAVRCKGAFSLRDAVIPAEGAWPEATGVNAKVEWNGPRIRASLEKGQAGEFQLESVDARWDAAGERSSRVTGRVHGRLEHALAWVRGHPELLEYAPHLQDLVARGDALFDFDVNVPAATSVSPTAKPGVRARVSTVLEGVQFRLAPDLPPVESLRGAFVYDTGRPQRSTLSATWLGGPLTLKIAERRDRNGSSLVVRAQGFVDARKLVALSQVRDVAEVSGETAWSGEFIYTPPGSTAPARWQGHADSNLVGVASELPAPLAKEATAVLPLHVEIIGSGEESEVRANLGGRVRTAFVLKVVDRQDWLIERGAIRFGGSAATLPAGDVIRVRGRVSHLDVPGYMLAWHKLSKGSPATRADVDITADEIVVGNGVYQDASVQVKSAADSAQSQSAAVPHSTALRIAAPSLGVLTGTLVPHAREVIVDDLRLVRDSFTGTGSVRCEGDLTTCRSRFELTSGDTAATLADFGFRADVSSAKGSLSGSIAWLPQKEGAWLESASGTLSMVFEDGVARRPSAATGRPFALLIVPALLDGVARPPGKPSQPAQPGLEPTRPLVSASAAGAGDLQFTRLEGHFQVRDGFATTTDLHFDGDAEILVRGRTGLISRDYDHEAWVLRGEERIPTSVRRLASAPRVAAAWLTLRELIGGNAAGRSRVVLRLRGTWNEPIVTVDQ